MRAPPRCSQEVHLEKDPARALLLHRVGDTVEEETVVGAEVLHSSKKKRERSESASLPFPSFAFVRRCEALKAFEKTMACSETSSSADDADVMILYIPEGSMEYVILRAVLEYLDFPYITKFEEEMKLTFPKLEGEPEALTLTGFRPIFTALTRLAHLLPSQAKDAGIVTEYIEKATHISLEDLESILECNLAEKRKWFAPQFEESTAADFFLVYRLRYEESTMGISYDKFPQILRYVAQDPSVDDDDDEEEVQPRKEGSQEGESKGCILS